MTLVLLITLVAMLAITSWCTYLLGFHVGGGRWLTEVARIRTESKLARAELTCINDVALENLAVLSRRRAQPSPTPDEPRLTDDQLAKFNSAKAAGYSHGPVPADPTPPAGIPPRPRQIYKVGT